MFEAFCTGKWAWQLSIIFMYFTRLWLFCLIWFFTSHQQSFSYLGVEPVLRINVSCSRTTTQWRRWGSNPRPFGLESSTLPLSHCAPIMKLWTVANIKRFIQGLYWKCKYKILIDEKTPILWVKAYPQIDAVLIDFSKAFDNGEAKTLRCTRQHQPVDSRLSGRQEVVYSTRHIWCTTG